MIKKRILNHLNDSKEVTDNMTVGELKNQFEKEIENNINKQIDEDDSIIKKYKDKYLKITKNEFSDNILDIIKINKLEPDSYTTDWRRTYTIEGYKIHFNEDVIIKKKLSESVSFTENELSKYEMISEGEFYKYVDKYNEFKDILNSVGVKKNSNE